MEVPFEKFYDKLGPIEVYTRRGQSVPIILQDCI